MRSTIYSLLAGIALVAGACTSTGVNTANVFAPQAGTIQLQAQTSDPSITAVEFALDSQNIGSGTPGTGTWTYNLDTTRFANGIHNLTATGMTSGGSQVQLLNNSLYINNPTSGGASGTAPATNASGASFFKPAPKPTKTPPWL